jgi:hypothetical protein
MLVTVSVIPSVEFGVVVDEITHEKVPGRNALLEIGDGVEVNSSNRKRKRVEVFEHKIANVFPDHRNHLPVSLILYIFSTVISQAGKRTHLILPAKF